MREDAELLRRYAEHGEERAFAELVRRRVDVVYAVALRRVGGDVQLAEDVTQRVFADLARKSAELSRRAVIGGWLYRSAQFAATDVVRAERRRKVREAEAVTMSEREADQSGVGFRGGAGGLGGVGAEGGGVDGGAAVDWDKVRPVLDQVMGELSDGDRDAVWLRYFEGRSFAEVGARLRLAENSARMRVERALDKLHAGLAKRGVKSTAAAVGVALGSQVSVASAPAGLAASVTGAALAGAVAAATGAAGGSAGGVGGVMVFMSTIKLQVGITAVLVVAGTTGWVAQSRADAELREEIAGLRAQTSAEVVGKLHKENARLAATAAEVEALRKDDVELARLRDEVAAVKAQQEQAARSVAEARAKRAAEIAAMPVYAEAQVEVQPEAKFQARPTIPKALRDLGGRGEARISYVVNADGEVSDVQALSSTDPEWAAAAVAAVKQWQFTPARKDGAAVNVRRELPMVFTNETKTTSERGMGRRFWF